MRIFLPTLALALLSSTSSHAATAVYLVTLNGASEAPGNDSTGTGLAKITFDDALMTMRVRMSFTGLTGTVTASHIHCCTSLPGLGTARVATQIPTFDGFPFGVTAGTYDHLFDMTQAFSWNSAFLNADPGPAGSTAAAYAALRAGVDSGRAYLNIHTTYRPGGEIRGFLLPPPVPEPATWAMMLTGFGLIGTALRRRQRTQISFG
jgi:hypothetical protein